MKRARYVAVEPPGQASLEQWLLERYGLAAGSGGQQPAATVWCGTAEGLGPRPVPEQLLAALFAAGRWKPSEIHVVSVTSRA